MGLRHRRVSGRLLAETVSASLALESCVGGRLVEGAGFVILSVMRGFAVSLEL
jgi:hypothetical protein